tara:strand:+ start:748 stop:1482 length:735 start_codon:yes stop_codon:yes gene_type:complete
MIWGMYLPRGGGPYGPDGDYEGPVDIYGDGWLHRLIKYGCEELSDEQRAFYGDGRRYAFCAIKKFHKENGYRGPSPDDRIVQPIEKHEPPLFFQLKRGYRELSSIISLPGRIWAVDESVKQIIERLEPSLHSFYPVEIRMRRGKVYPVQYYVLVVGKYLESFSPEESDPYSFKPQEANGVRWYILHGYKAEVTGLAFRKAMHANVHLWRERGLEEWLICLSGELESALREAKLKLPKYYRMIEV